MNDLQMLVTGHIAGSLLRADHMSLEVELGRDAKGNYLPEILVMGIESGTQLKITVEVVDG